MKNNLIITALISLVIGVGATAGAAVIIAQSNADDDTYTMTTQQPGSMSMDDMNNELAELNADEFDEAFLQMMTEHHAGALAMAKLAETRANRPEIKALSKSIIESQEKEISQMQQWQMDWGYMTSETMMPGMNH